MRLARNARARASDTPCGTTSSTRPRASIRTATRRARRLWRSSAGGASAGPCHSDSCEAAAPAATSSAILIAMMITAPPPGLIDIGANLTHESFAHDLPEILRRAHRAGVECMIVTGTSVAATRAALALHGDDPLRLFAT